MHTFQSKPGRACPGSPQERLSAPRWRGGPVQDLAQAAGPQDLSGNSWNLPVFHLPGSLLLPTSLLSLRFQFPWEYVTLSSAFLGQWRLPRPTMPLGGLRQKQVGHGSLGPKPGPVRIEETPAQTGHLTSVRGKAEQGTQAEQVGSQKHFPRDQSRGLGCLFSEKFACHGTGTPESLTGRCLSTCGPQQGPRPP